jgi:hypothetical protein
MEIATNQPITSTANSSSPAVNALNDTDVKCHGLYNAAFHYL